MLTPMDIHNHKFKKAFRGYSENDVDDFLDKVVEDFEKLLNENERLNNQLYTSEKEVEQYRKLEKTLNDTLMVAQRTADEVISSARKNADEMKENAARECQNIREQARLEGKQQVDAAIAKRDAILAEYEKIVRDKQSFLMKLRIILESELTLTNQMIKDVPKVSEAVKDIQPEETAPVEEPAPVQESEPVAEPEPEEIPEVDDDTKVMKIIDVSTKPVAEDNPKKSKSDTKTYKITKSSKPKPDEEAAN